MDKTLFAVFGLVIVLYIAVLTAMFQYNLPNWCSNPSDQGNSIVHPLCK